MQSPNSKDTRGLAVQTLIEACPLAIVGLDMQGNVTLWSPAAEHLFGWTRKEVIGKRYPLVPEHRWNEVLSTLQRLSGDTCLGREERIREHKTGRLIDVSVSTSPLFGDDGKLVGVIAIYADNTDRNHAQEELCVTNTMLRTQQETSPDGILAVDEKGIILSFNRRFSEMWGIPLELLEPRSDAPVLQAVLENVHNPDEFLSRVQYLYTQREESSHDEILLTDGRILERFSSPMISPEGAYYGRVWYFRDISQRKRAEKERAAFLDQLHHAQKMEALGQLAGGLAHDFQNLLSVILSNLDSLQRLLPADPQAIETAADIRAAAEQALGATRSLLTFSRRLPVEKKPVFLNPLIENAARMLRRLLPACMELIVDVAKPAPIQVQADANQLQQVLFNLAINARDAMPNGGTLTIALSLQKPPQAVASSDWACVSVADTGEGIPQAAQPHLFEPFFSTKPRGQGTGLGLAIVHGIVEDHGGRIHVESQVGQGATFRIYLPCSTTGAANCPDPISEKASPGRHETIIVADDDPFVRGTIASMLRELNYDVMSVADGPAALEVWRSCADRIRLLILDVHLPILPGIDCLHMIREAGSIIPAILITADPDPRLEDEIDRRTLVLPKPFNTNQLAILVNRILARYGGKNHG